MTAELIIRFQDKGDGHVRIKTRDKLKGQTSENELKALATISRLVDEYLQHLKNKEAK